MIRRSLAYSLSADGAGLFLQLLLSAVISRILTPAEIGLFSIAVGATTIVTSLRDFGVGRYILKIKDIHHSHIQTAFSFMLVVGWSLGALVYLVRGPVAGIYDDPRVAELLAITAVSFFIVPFGQPAKFVLSRKMLFGRVAFISLSAHIASTAATIYLAVEGYGALSLAYGMVVNAAVTSVASLALAPGYRLVRPSLTHWRELLSFGGVSSATTLLTTTVMQLPELIIGKFLGFSEAGFYTRGSGLANLFQRAVMASIGQVLEAAFGKINRESGDLRNAFNTVVSYISVISWPFFLFVGIFADPMVRILFGGQWASAVPIVQALSVARALSISVIGAQYVYVGLGAVGTQFKSEIILQPISLILLAAALPFGLQAVADSRIVLGIAVVLVHMLAMHKLIHVSLFHWLSHIRGALYVMAPLGLYCGILLWVFGPASEMQALAVGAVGLGYGVIYLASLFLSNHPILVEFSIIRRNFPLLGSRR